MESLVPYRQIFWKHKAHWILLGVSVAIPLVSAHLFGLIFGAGLYLVGIINLPDFKLFRKIVDKELSEKAKEEVEQKRLLFIEKRDRQIRSLSSEKKAEYKEITDICREIESSFDGMNGGELFMARIDEIMWTFLKLLGIQQSLEMFLNAEASSKTSSKDLKEVNANISRIENELIALGEDASANAIEIDHKEKMLISYNERASIINKREEKTRTASNSLELVNAEKQRLVEQIKFIRAEVISSKNPDSISVKLDSNLQNLGETNKWISQMSEFADMTDQIPLDGSFRIGFRIGEVNASGMTKSESSLADKGYIVMTEYQPKVKKPKARVSL